MPATAGGSTSGSSTNVTSNALPRKRRVARRYAVGVPNTTMSNMATTLVSAVTRSASSVTSLVIPSTSSLNESSAKIATMGIRRNASDTDAAATRVAPNGVGLTADRSGQT